MMNKKSFIVCLFLLSGGVGKAINWGWTQTEMPRFKPLDVPTFYYDVINVTCPRDSSLSRLNLYMKIAYDELQFLKVGEGYKARYEISVVVFDRKGDQADGKIWQEEVVVKEYELTNSRNDFSFTYTSFDLKPSEYQLVIGLMDLDTRKTATRKSTVRLRNFDKDKLALSNITFASNIEVDSLGVKSIRPEIAGLIKDVATELFAYFEIYSKGKANAVKVSYEIRNAKGKLVKSDSYFRKKTGHRTMDYFKIDNTGLEYGKYLLSLKVREGRLHDSTQKLFMIRWIGMPASVTDLKTAIEQLQYLLDKSKINKMLKASESERWEQFTAFWDERDPTPGTKVNEWMEEYYRRVEYANENFSTFREGWKTDMGMIYIIFGPPSDIERRPFDKESKPYEIWYYYSINRQFLFVDETGFGEYKLYTPFWESWRRP